MFNSSTIIFLKQTNTFSYQTHETNTYQILARTNRFQSNKNANSLTQMKPCVVSLSST